MADSIPASKQRECEMKAMALFRAAEGSLALFPPETTDETIAAALRQQYPEPRPQVLNSGEWAHRANGASINLSASMGRFVIYNAAGTPRGFRLTLDDAIDSADAMSPLPPPRVARPEAPTLTSTASESQISHEIDLHIRQRDSRARVARRASTISERRCGRL